MSLETAVQQPLLGEEIRGLREDSRPGIERRFDVPFVARLALKEKQIQQNVRPIIAAHKWFARRPGSLFRALLLAEFGDGPLREAYYLAHRFAGLRVADPFMGGGTPLLEANRLGCDVAGWDVNPMAYWVVRQEITHLDLGAYLAAARRIEADLQRELGHLQQTRCLLCGNPDAPVKYLIWVKTKACCHCGKDIDLFPGYLLAAAERHPKDVVICAACGELAEVEDRARPGRCPACRAPLILDGPAGRSRCACPHCGRDNRYPDPEGGPPAHRMVALEYHCRACRPHHRGRFFKRPEAADLERYREAARLYGTADTSLVPDDPIPPGDETARLHRWGYRLYREMFNPRQLLGLARLAASVAAVEEPRVRSALATNLSDLLRYQNMLCRYDTRALKSLDVFSVHGFPVGLVQCESNFLGIRNEPGGANVGSGGWSNIVDKFARAKSYCDAPFEIRYGRSGKSVVPVAGEWIGDRRNGAAAGRRRVELQCASATAATLPIATLDAVLTDPPYFANVQYAELMEFCYVWLRKLVAPGEAAFAQTSTRRAGDLTGNQTLERGLEQFVAGLSTVYRRFAAALKPGRPFAFTYHHNSLEAYHPVAVALLDAGLACTAVLPCPAEMGGSIHIHNSESSIVDSVFVCRSRGEVPRRLLADTPGEVATLVAEELEFLRVAGVAVTRGDARCVTFGHLVRLAVWKLRGRWNAAAGWAEKLAAAGEAISRLPSWEEILRLLEEPGALATRRGEVVREAPAEPWGDVGPTVVF
jgi:adenine-specific DNA methylase